MAYVSAMLGCSVSDRGASPSSVIFRCVVHDFVIDEQLITLVSGWARARAGMFGS